VRTELVGRDAELGVLVNALEGALAGQPRIVLCQGEPGIGKTRLIEDLVQIATERGALVAWGLATDSFGAPPHWEWWQILRRVAKDIDVLKVADGLGSRRELAGRNWIADSWARGSRAGEAG